MRIRFVSKGSLRDFKNRPEEEGADITLFGFEGMGEVSYEKELKGESSFFEDGALLSKAEKNIVVCGCITDTRGHKRKSALVAECGKLLGVSDMLYVLDEEYGAGAELRIYPTKLGKMGVVVAEDLHFSEMVRALSVCGCDFIVCPFGKITGELQSVLLRANAFQFGVPIFLCGEGYCMIGDPKGELAFSSPLSPVCVDYAVKKEYRLVERRRKMAYPCQS